MRILGVDTATPTASVALVEDGELAAEEIYPSRETIIPPAARARSANHAEVILPLVDTVLSRRGLSLGHLSGLALSIGPGSFTGLRIGLSTIKGLAYGSALPVVGVSTLLANASRPARWEGLICSLLDARKNEVYASLFLKNGAQLGRLTEDLVAPAHSVAAMIQRLGASTACLFVGDGCEVYKPLLSDQLGAQAHFLGAEEPSPSVACAVARLSHERFRGHDVDSLATLTPVYVRPSEAEFRLRDVL
jgi:tRNA threonylcarbamoyladenosine biosynthesis protein TsaB